MTESTGVRNTVTEWRPWSIILAVGGLEELVDYPKLTGKVAKAIHDWMEKRLREGSCWVSPRFSIGVYAFVKSINIPSGSGSETETIDGMPVILKFPHQPFQGGSVRMLASATLTGDLYSDFEDGTQLPDEDFKGILNDLARWLCAHLECTGAQMHYRNEKWFCEQTHQ